MDLTRRPLLASAAATVAAPAIVCAHGDKIRIGEINSYTAVPAFTLGWMLAVEQIPATRWTALAIPTTARSLPHKDGRGTLVDWRYVDGAAALPPDDVGKTLRAA